MLFDRTLGVLDTLNSKHMTSQNATQANGWEKWVGGWGGWVGGRGFVTHWRCVYFVALPGAVDCLNGGSEARSMTFSRWMCA